MGNQIKWYSSITYQLSFFIVLLTTLILAGFGVFEYAKAKKIMSQELNSFAEITATRLSNHLILPIWGVDKTLTDNALNAEMMEKKIAGIIIRDANETNIFTGIQRDSQWSAIPVNSDISGDFIKIKKSITQKGKELGFVEVYITKKLMEKELKQTLLKIIQNVLILNITIFLAIYILIRQMIIRHILSISRTAEEVSMGNLESSIDIKSNNEIGLLIDAFERMRASLKIAFKRIKKT